MASPTHSTVSFRSQLTPSPASQSRIRRTVSTKTRKIIPPSDATGPSPGTVFDLLYNSHLPFRLYADYMLGSSPAELARQFALSEDWVLERIEAVRLCGKQVRVNLFDSAYRPDSTPQPIG